MSLAQLWREGFVILSSLDSEEDDVPAYKILTMATGFYRNAVRAGPKVRHNKNEFNVEKRNDPTVLIHKVSLSKSRTTMVASA